MADNKLIDEGKYRIQTVGPVKSGVGKASGKPWKTFDLQFEGDGTWYTAFWSRDTDPQVGEELQGKKEYSEQFKAYQFNMGFGGNKSNWNPGSANATILGVSAVVVHDAFELGMVTREDWDKRAIKGETAMQHYIRTVAEVADILKPAVTKMGGDATKTEEKTSTPPPDDGDPGPVAPGVEDDELDLGPL